MTPLRSTPIKATRKEHYCEWCPENIAVGQPAIYRAYIFGGDFIHAHMHPECHEAMIRSEWDEFESRQNKRGQAADEWGDPLEPKPQEGP